MNYKFLLLISCLFFFFSCKKIDQTLLHGKWKGATMTSEGQVIDNGAEHIEFNFHPNNTYSYSILSYKEAGSFRTLEDKLYTIDTTRAERLEKPVRVKLITTDSLHLEMNDKGIPKLLKCYKAK